MPTIASISVPVAAAGVDQSMSSSLKCTTFLAVLIDVDRYNTDITDTTRYQPVYQVAMNLWLIYSVQSDGTGTENAANGWSRLASGGNWRIYAGPSTSSVALADCTLQLPL